MGWTVLYIAFGVVALWLLGEVLLQYKARLRWRVLAFCGFLFVVVGVLLPSVPVIVAGALAFAVGQTYVTLSFRRGFSTGWAIGGNPGASRRRKAGAPNRAGPTLEVTELSYDEPGAGHHTPERHPDAADDGTAVYEPLPMPDDTGQYGVYDTGRDTAPAADAGYDPAAYAPYAAGHEQGYGQGYEQQGHDHHGYEQPVHQQGYDYGAAGQQQYAAYSDPYIGPGTDAQQYGSYYGDPYAPSYTYDTPPGGVWVPQQRDTEPDPHQQAPGPYGHEPHQDDRQQYRY
ncbi:hypothetical protein ACFY5H_03445 [Streptomyces sp. NPDC013012]|uniref:hypothetical protein n=1 Tax=Streptomyces sp. NPDC013012 TaxID=3364860 RepID=UPI003677CE4A